MYDFSGSEYSGQILNTLGSGMSSEDEFVNTSSRGRSNSIVSNNSNQGDNIHS